MEDQEELILVGDNGEIPAGLPGSIMRKSMENKNLLKQKDSIYIGTGEKDEDGVAITKALEPGKPNTVLCVDNDEKVVFSKLNHNMVTASRVNMYGEVVNKYNISCSKIKKFPYNGHVGLVPAIPADFAEVANCVKYVTEEKTSSFNVIKNIYSTLQSNSNWIDTLEDFINN